jgi:hypothetical protein
MASCGGLATRLLPRAPRFLALKTFPSGTGQPSCAANLLLLSLIASLAWADGGTVLFHKPAGDFDITLFSKSEAVRAGINDLSVLVQRPDHSTVMDATVLLHLEQKQTSGDILRLTAIATHAKATNKTLYAVPFNIPATGSWHLEADITSQGKTGIATGEITVLPPLPPVVNYWPYVAMVPALGVAFLINRKLRQRYRPR